MRAWAATALSARPPDTSRRDPLFVAIAALSLAAHVALILPMLLHRQQPETPHEIPVELVQMPPPQPKAEPAKQAAKAAAQQKPAAAQKPEPPQAKPAGQPRKAPEAKTAPEPKKAAEPKTTPEPKTEPKPSSKPSPKPSDTATRAAVAQHDVSQRIENLLGAMPAIALPGAADTGTEEVPYRQLVLSKLAKAKREGRSMGVPGAASISFTLDDAGNVVRCEIVRKSVDPNLDAEAVAMVRRGAPYPAPPPGAQRDFVITLRFDAMP